MKERSHSMSQVNLYTIIFVFLNELVLVYHLLNLVFLLTKKPCTCEPIFFYWSFNLILRQSRSTHESIGKSNDDLRFLLEYFLYSEIAFSKLPEAFK